MNQAGNIFAYTSRPGCKWAGASTAPRRNLSLPIRSTFAAAAFAVVFLAGAFMVVPAQAHFKSPAYTFSKALGGPPVGQLVKDANGDIFGVTDGCKSSGCSNGTIYELPYSSEKRAYESLKVLANLSTSSNGNEYGPTGGLAIDSNGDLFGVTGTGLVFELQYNGGYKTSVTVLNSDQLIAGVPTGTLVYDADNGNLYGVTKEGGSSMAQGIATGISSNWSAMETVASTRPSRPRL